jgi:hypothetical protein
VVSHSDHQVGGLPRGSPTAVRVIRIFLHLIMRMSVLIGLPSHYNRVGALVFPRVTRPKDVVVLAVSCRVNLLLYQINLSRWA